MRLLKQSSTAQPLVFLMVLASDHVTAATGLTPTVTLSKSGGSFASPSGAVTEIANGWYKVAGNATDTGTLGPLILHATGTAADPCDVQFDVVGFDPQDAVSLGLSRIDAAVTTRSSHTAADVWTSTTRTLSSYGTLVADAAAAVWAAATRTLSAFAFTVDTNANATETSIKAKTDNLPASPAATSDIPTANITAIKAKTDNLPAAPASVSDIPSVAAIAAQVTTDHGAGSYIRNTEPDNASVTAIKAKTDNLPASPAATDGNVNVTKINGTAVIGTGITSDKWRA